MTKSAKKVKGSITFTNSTYNVSFENEYKYMDIDVTKTWDDNDDQDGLRRNNNIDSVEVKLYQSTEDEEKSLANIENNTISLSDDNEWTYSWNDLPRYKDGKEILYEVEETIEENSILDKEYTQTINDKSANSKFNYEIINSHTPETIDIAGEKTWDDDNDRDKERPSYINVYLIADGDTESPLATQRVMVDENGDWKYKFEGYPKYKDGWESLFSDVKFCSFIFSVFISSSLLNEYSKLLVNGKNDKEVNDSNEDRKSVV